MTKEFGIRERKKSQLRLDLLSTLIDTLHTTSFEAIKVKELCDQVCISEVTFFKYFEKKEELLQYYMKVWNYKRELSFLTSKRPTGKKAIYQLFLDIAHTDNATHFLNTLISYMTRLSALPKQIHLTPCEKWLINQDKSLANVPSIEEQVSIAYDEAIEEGSLNPIDKETFLNAIATIYYGSPVMAHITNVPLETLYKNNLDTLFDR